MANDKINCPKCNTQIDINELLYKSIDNELKSKYENEANQKELIYISKLKELDSKQKSLESQKEEIESLINNQVSDKLKLEKKKIETEIKSKLNEENSIIISEMNNELKIKSEQIKDLAKTKAEMAKLQREKDELKDILELENQRKLNEAINEERAKIKRSFEDEHLLKDKDQKKLIADLMAQIEEMKRKAELGSQQRQGETQEQEIESILSTQFPFDIINEIKKGQKGGDCIQSVRSNFGKDCGKIYYESKRTKDFSNSWIQKLKDDNLDVKADILVIVTQAMPDNEEKYTFKDGVWICHFNEIRWFSRVLRQGLMDLQAVTITHQNKDVKMEALYHYLTSKEFKGQLETIIDGFSSLQKAHEDEKKKMKKIWAEKEKQFERILDNTIGFYGSLKGIAGASIPDIPMLEEGDQLFLNE